MNREKNGKAKRESYTSWYLYNHIVYLLGVDEIGKHYSIEEHEYNVGSAYSVYRDYYILEDSEIVDLRQRVRVRGNS